GAWPRCRPPRRRKTGCVRRVRVRRGIQPWGEEGVVLGPISSKEAVREHQAATVRRGASLDSGAGDPLRVSPAVAVEPGVENIVHQRGCIARLKSVRARRHVVWIGASVDEPALRHVTAGAGDLARLPQVAKAAGHSDRAQWTRVCLFKKEALAESGCGRIVRVLIRRRGWRGWKRGEALELLYLGGGEP